MVGGGGGAVVVTGLDVVGVVTSVVAGGGVVVVALGSWSSTAAACGAVSGSGVAQAPRTSNKDAAAITRFVFMASQSVLTVVHLRTGREG